MINCHHPLLPTSWSLLDPHANTGIDKIKLPKITSISVISFISG